MAAPRNDAARFARFGLYAAYVRALMDQQPGALAQGVTPGYVLNGRNVGPDGAVHALNQRVAQWGRGLTRVDITITTRHSQERGQRQIIFATEQWTAIGTGLTTQAEFGRRDVWVKTVQGWKLAASDVQTGVGFVD